MLDLIDRGLVHALQIDGRAPFARIATVLGVSLQTVTRRYRALRADAGLRVLVLADPARSGTAQWLVRLTAAPAAAGELAAALARRSDTSWVKLASGGTEIVTVVAAPVGAAASALLLHDIPRTAAVTAVSAHYLLHTYLGGPTAWRGRTAVLTAEQRAQLAPEPQVPQAAAPGPRAELGPGDAPLMAALGRDGRTRIVDLAAATGWAPSTVARRLTELTSGGAVFFDVEIDASRFGAATAALLWMSVAPSRLDEVATVLAGHEELAFVAATTGPTNLVAHAQTSDPAALHRYLTGRLGALEAVRTLETAPVLRTVKAAGPVRLSG